MISSRSSEINLKVRKRENSKTSQQIGDGLSEYDRGRIRRMKL